MVYDPIRDVDLPSPAVSTSTQQSPFFTATPGAGPSHPQHESPYINPPSFVHDARSPGPGAIRNMLGLGGEDSRARPVFRSGSGSLRGLLNDDGPGQAQTSEGESRRSSAQGSSFSSAGHLGDDAYAQHSTHANQTLTLNQYPGGIVPTPALRGPARNIQLLMNESAPMISKSNSGSSLTHSVDSNMSPPPRVAHLDPDGFRAPATPSYSHPRSSRSPYPSYLSVSPQTTSQSLPQDHHGYDPPYSQSNAIRQHQLHGAMLPPQTPQESYDPSQRYTPGSQYQSLPPRADSASLSPRSMNMPLPNLLPPQPKSRPSSSGANSSFSFQGSALVSPAAENMRLPSGEHSRPGSSSAQNGNENGNGNGGGRRRTLPTRQQSHSVTPGPSIPSQTAPAYSSPEIARTAYEARHRLTAPSSVLQSITPNERSALQASGLQNNPLRRRQKRSLPSWSGPSSSSINALGPHESDSSYFPPHDERRMSLGLSTPNQRGRDSTYAGGSGYRPSITPGGGAYAADQAQRHTSPYNGSGMPPTPSADSGPRRRRPSGSASGLGAGAGAGQANHLKRASDNSPPAHGGDTTRRKVSANQYVGNAAVVATHYNSRQEVGVDQREYSPIIGLKKFNNWIKSVLIGKFAFRQPKGPGANVLDIGCGKGGDLQKWKQARINLYVGMDIAATSVEQAQERYAKLHRPGFQAQFYAHDCYTRPISEVLPPDLAVPQLYHNVTMQFCMHYAFDTIARVRMMLENATRYLRKDGYFVGTIPIADLLLRKLEDLPDGELVFGNSVYSVEFTKRNDKRIYGNEYRFFLDDAVEQVPEYLVHWDEFEALAAEYKLQLAYKKTFSEILNEEQSTRDFGPLLSKMGVVNAQGASAMDQDQWECANLYMGFAFVKL